MQAPTILYPSHDFIEVKRAVPMTVACHNSLSHVYLAVFVAFPFPSLTMLLACCCVLSSMSLHRAPAFCCSCRRSSGKPPEKTTPSSSTMCCITHLFAFCRAAVTTWNNTDASTPRAMPHTAHTRLRSDLRAVIAGLVFVLLTLGHGAGVGIHIDVDDTQAAQVAVGGRICTRGRYEGQTLKLCGGHLFTQSIWLIRSHGAIGFNRLMKKSHQLGTQLG